MVKYRIGQNNQTVEYNRGNKWQESLATYYFKERKQHMKTLKKLFILLLLLTVSITVIACFENGNTIPKTEYELVFDSIQIGYAQGDSQHAVTSNLTLPVTTTVQTTATISWMSSNPEIIQANGIVNRPAVDTQVTLALVVTINDVSQDRTTIITVLASSGNVTPDRVVITFETDGGTTVSSQEINQGSTAIRPSDPTKDNHLFVTWILDGEPFDFSQEIHGNITLIAKWEAVVPADDPLIPGRTLTFQDEFNGTTLDLTKWDYQNGTGKEYGLDFWGNNEKQIYQTENVEVSGGTLKLHARMDDVFDPYTGHRMFFTSGKIVTLGRFAQTYGRFEAKIKAPVGQGFWPAFWLMPVNNTYGNGWPFNGEIDIFEARGRFPGSASSAIHFQGANGHRYLTSETGIPNNGRIDEFNVYAVEWSPGLFQFSINGFVYHTQNNSWHNAPEPFNHDFYIILNLAIGGIFDGNRIPGPERFPAALEVDYVRVYAMQ